MDIADALAIVLDLAKGRLADPTYLVSVKADRPDDEPREQKAIRVIEDLAANEYGDD